MRLLRAVVAGQQSGLPTSIGVVNEMMLDLFKDVLEKGLARLEGYVKRGDITNVSRLGERLSNRELDCSFPFPFLFLTSTIRCSPHQ